MRSDFLIHWTGKDIALDRSTLRDTDRADYIGRLASILANGFWMTIFDERIQGSKGAWIKYETPMTCFTEVRLSQTVFHAKRYGLMGIGVSRQFVLDRRGGPVHYVRNHDDECVVGNVQEILRVLKGLGEPELVEYFGVNTSFIKSMSDANTDNFMYLDEQEWRIVHTHSQEKARNIVATDDSQPPYRIPVRFGDVRIVVFPDNQTRTKARSDPTLNAWFQDPSTSNVILLTIEECGHF